MLTVDTEATVTVIDVSADVLEACVARSADHPVDVVKLARDEKHRTRHVVDDDGA